MYLDKCSQSCILILRLQTKAWLQTTFYTKSHKAIIQKKSYNLNIYTSSQIKRTDQVAEDPDAAAIWGPDQEGPRDEMVVRLTLRLPELRQWLPSSSPLLLLQDMLHEDQSMNGQWGSPDEHTYKEGMNIRTEFTFIKH